MKERIEMTQQITHAISALVANSKTVYVSSVDENGYPNTKAMYPTKHGDLKTHYFSTNLSSRRAAQFKVNPKACIYFCGESDIEGVMLSVRQRCLPTPIIRNSFGVKGMKNIIPRVSRMRIIAFSSLPQAPAGIFTILRWPLT